MSGLCGRARTEALQRGSERVAECVDVAQNFIAERRRCGCGLRTELGDLVAEVAIKTF
jgi:hypothetical protein